MTKAHRRALFAAGLIAALAGWIAWSNIALETTFIAVKSACLPAAFNGFCIAQVSDLHDAELGGNHSRLIAALTDAQPDAIALTGDMVDSSRTDVENTLAFARQAAQIAPTYYVNGNHEALIPAQDYAALTDGLRACGVTVLEDESTVIGRDGDSIQIIGLNDIGHLNVSGVNAKIAAMQQTLESLMREHEGFSVVLSHRPELIDAYAYTAADLVLSGHAHGGQFRLPILGGLIAPGQGLLPEYDSGLYEENSTQMIVSRGIGNSVIPVRFNNRPELVVITLQTK